MHHIYTTYNTYTAANRGVLQKKMSLKILKILRKTTVSESLAQVFSCEFSNYLRTSNLRKSMNGCF